jgi:hypothetical protein
MAKPNLPWQVILMVMNLLLFLTIPQVWCSKSPAPAINPAQKVERKLIDFSRRDSQPEAAFAIVATKNLFSAKRHSDIGGNGDDQEVDLDKSLLQGIIVVGQGRAALLGSKDPQQNDKVEIIRPGETWHGYKVLEIGPEAVVFKTKEGEKRLHFPEPKAKEGIVWLQ